MILGFTVFFTTLCFASYSPLTLATCNTILYFGTFFLEEELDVGSWADGYMAARLDGFYYSVTRYASINYIPNFTLICYAFSSLE